MKREQEDVMDQRLRGPREPMGSKVTQVANVLELCWGCDRVCECEQWLVNEAVPVWLCIECLAEVTFRLERQSGVPITLSPALTES